MTTRLTAETISRKTLDAAAKDQAGLLGTYSREEYDALMAVDLESWTFEWKPFKMDETVGRVKMRPLNERAVKLLDSGRAKALTDRHDWLSHDRAIKFIRATKRHPSGGTKQVQDFLLTNWRQTELQALTDDAKMFEKVIRAYFKDGVSLNRKHIDAVRELLPKVLTAMKKSHRRRGPRTN